MFDPSLFVSVVFVLLLLAVTATQLWLIHRQNRHVSAHRGTVPRAFASTISLPHHQKAADYTLAKNQLAVLEVGLQAALVLGWTLLGGLHALNQLLTHFWGAGLGQQLALVAVFALVSTLVDMPLAWFRAVRLESRFGFNRMSSQGWLGDQLKMGALAAAIGLPLVALLLTLMDRTGPWWWLWAWGTWMAFNLALMVIFPTVIAPMFNTFKPLNDANLAERVQQLMSRCGFQADGVFVMDGSKRSAHGNAYFTGLGKAKRVVFYDTLLAQLEPAEVEAVLAHELGHFHHQHLRRRLLTMAAMTLLGFAALGWLSSQTAFYTGLGVAPNPMASNGAVALLLFLLCTPLLGFYLSPLWASRSRQDEYQADRFAATHAQGPALVSALLKLHQDNASTLTPDPWYVWFHYSHPPANERLSRVLQA